MSQRWRVLIAVLAAATALPAHAQAEPVTERVSVSQTGGQLNGHSHAAAFSSDARFAAFLTDATNLQRPRKPRPYVMMRDRESGETFPVTRAEIYSTLELSGDGRFVAFDDHPGIFVHDRRSGRTRVVSRRNDDSRADVFTGERFAISDGGGRVAFAALVRRRRDSQINAYVRLRGRGRTVRANVKADGSAANGDVRRVALSRNGQVVAFQSDSTNLVPGDTNGLEDVFVRDLAAGTTTRVSVSSSGEQAILGEGEFAGGGSQFPALSADGRYVAFNSYSSNLVPGDTNAESDVFVHDRVTGETRRVSVASDGTQADQGALAVDISADGRIVLFDSRASNLVPGDTDDRFDLFAHDTASGATIEVADGSVASPAISADGTFVGFISHSKGLVAGDTNNRADVFVSGPFDWGTP
jgi:Tol biopolymer transport system component